MTTLDQLLYGIRKLESGGNYHVVNSIGAVGAYQVMKDNIPSWTKRALGKSMTWQQFRASKSAQDAVARYILGGYYRKYGAAGAASMWFSGQPNPNKAGSDGSTTIRNYVNVVIKYSNASKGLSGTSKTGSTYSVASASPALDERSMAESYGLTWSTINSNKELKGLFKKAVSAGYTSDRFTAELKNTKWWRTTSDSARKFFMLRTGDPATYKQQYQSTAYKVAALATTVGVRNLLTKGTTPGHIDPFLNGMVMFAMRDGWSDARIKNYLGRFVQIKDGVMGGEAGDAFDQLHQTAYLNGLTHSADWYLKTVRSIVSGTSTQEAADAGMRRVAAAKYSAFSNQIMAGQNAMDLAQPYISDVARILELPQTDVDLFNTHVQNAMSAKGTAAGAQYPLWQFEYDLRSDPLWKKTNNSRESMFGVARQVARDFGFAY
jgi:hypothetical protein